VKLQINNVIVNIKVQIYTWRLRTQAVRWIEPFVLFLDI